MTKIFVLAMVNYRLQHRFNCPSTEKLSPGATNEQGGSRRPFLRAHVFCRRVYAFLALKISKDSQPLTTFLTPTGSYQWVSLPTGAANSPVHFTNALNKILHYRPVRDKMGNLIYSSPNVVKMEKDPLPLTSNYFDDVINTSYTKETYELTLDSHF